MVGPRRPRERGRRSTRASARPRASSARRSAARSSRSPAPGVAFAVNAGSFLAELRRAARARRRRSCTGRSATTGRRVVGGALDALRFVVALRRAPASRSSACSCSRRSAFNFNVLLPAARRRGRSTRAPQTFGLIAAVFGAGALVRRAHHRARAARTACGYLLGGAFGYGVLELVLAPQTSLAVVCVLLFLTGLFYTSGARTRSDGDPARGAGAPARPRGEPLLLGVPRRRAARRPLRRLARRRSAARSSRSPSRASSR